MDQNWSIVGHPPPPHPTPPHLQKKMHRTCLFDFSEILPDACHSRVGKTLLISIKWQIKNINFERAETYLLFQISCFVGLLFQIILVLEKGVHCYFVLVVLLFYSLFYNSIFIMLSVK